MRRAQLQAADCEAFEAWYRAELDRAPPVDDEAALTQLWQTLESAPSAAARLREIRKHYRLTQIEMAAIVDVEQGTVSRWESGETDITDGHLIVYAYLCQGAALAFLRYGAAGTQDLPRPADDRAPPTVARRSTADATEKQSLGRIGAGQVVRPIEVGAVDDDQASRTVRLPIDDGSETALIALEVDDAADLYPLRPGWLVIYAAADGAAAAATPGVLTGQPAGLDACINRLCVVALTEDRVNGARAGQILLREIRAARQPGAYELATFRAVVLEPAEIAWASPVIALLPPPLGYTTTHVTLAHE